MAARAFTFLVLPAILAAGFALAAGSATIPAGKFREAPIPEGQLDRAADFRPAQVGECGAVERERVSQVARDERSTPRVDEGRTPDLGCNVTWAD
jgi:hypothetical protein